MLQQVILERGKAASQWSRIPEGTQTHVHPEYLAIDGRCGQQSQQLLSLANEKLVVTDRIGVLRFSVFGKQEDQIDVGRKVEFATTELAHANDDKWHIAAISLPRRTIARRSHLPSAVGGKRDRIVGKGR